MAINSVNLVGNVTADAEMSKTSSGVSVCNFSIAVEEYRKDAENYTSFFSCTLFGIRAEKLEKYILKGSKIAVSGRLHQSRWESGDGKRERVTVTVDQIELMSGRRDPQPEPRDRQPSPIADEDIPF